MRCGIHVQRRPHVRRVPRARAVEPPVPQHNADHTARIDDGIFQRSHPAGTNRLGTVSLGGCERIALAMRLGAGGIGKSDALRDQAASAGSKRCGD